MTEEVYSNGPFASRFEALTDVRDMQIVHGVPPTGYSVQVCPAGDQWIWRAQVEAAVGYLPPGPNTSRL